MRPLAGADNHVSEATTTTACALPARASSAADHALPPRSGSPLFTSDAADMAHEVIAAAPAVTATAASATAFLVTARAARAAAYSAGVSCATPVLGVAWGVATVGGASALAGHAARVVLEPPRDPHAAHSRWPVALLGSVTAEARRHPLYAAAARLVDPDEATKDAMFGSLAYALLGRGVRTALPSDVSHPGALARRSMPSNGAHYATDAQRRTLAVWLRKDGCHHCGSRSGPVIGDHMPPNKMAFGSAAAAQAAREGTWKVRLWNFLRMVPKQRFYPQCRKCSDAQSVAVRAGKKMLVQHGGGMKLGAVVATAVAARQYARTRHPEEYAAFERKLERFPLWA